jgi:hypothetical protein
MRLLAIAASSVVVLAAAAPPPSVDAGPAAAGPSVRDAVLREALYVVRRDHCILVDGDALLIPSYDYDKKGRVAAVRTAAPSCDEQARPLALLSSLRAGLALVGQKQGADAADALKVEGDRAKADAGFAALFGKPLLNAATQTKSGQLLYAYDPGALQAAFDALYVGPKQKVLGASAQALYDKVARAPLAVLARDLGALLKNKARLGVEAKKWEQRANKPDDGAATDALRASLNALVTSTDDAARIDPALVGFVLRRQRDGTLPVIVSSLRRVLQEYDPGTARLLDGRT